MSNTSTKSAETEAYPRSKISQLYFSLTLNYLFKCREHLGNSSTRLEDVDDENDATDDFISKDGQIDNEPLWVPAKITSNDNVLLVGQLFCSNCRSPHGNYQHYG